MRSHSPLRPCSGRPAIWASRRTTLSGRWTNSLTPWQRGLKSRIRPRLINARAPRITRGFQQISPRNDDRAPIRSSFSGKSPPSPAGCPLVFASNRLGLQQFGPFRVSEGFDSGLLEVNQPRLPDGTQQLAAHLLDGCKHVLDPRPCLGDALVAPLLALRQGLVPVALPLDLVPEAVLLQPGFTFRRRIAPVGIDVAARVGGVEDLVEVLAVMRAGRVGLDLADELVFLASPPDRSVPSRPGWCAAWAPAPGWRR